MKNALCKKFVPILLSLLLVVQALPNLALPILAAQDGDFTYELIDSGTNVSITKYTGTGSNVTIPSTIGGKNVTSIGNFSFESCKSVTTITIPNSVTSIGMYAFMLCSSLTTITIPDSVTSIGMYAFQLCSSLATITIPKLKMNTQFQTL